MPTRLPTAIVLLFQALPLAGSEPERHIDAAWFRSTLAAETTRWRDAASTPPGFFQVSLDRQWRPAARQAATLVSQCRLLYVMAEGFEQTGQPAFLDSLRRGADFLLTHFRDREFGGYFYSVARDGKPIDDFKDSYGHAFVIFGLSHAARVTRDARYRDAALEAWAEMKQRLRYPDGFFKPRTTRDYSEVRGVNTQNPMMHLFEALLALHDATGSPAVLADARAHADRIFARLLQEPAGYLPELYDGQWRPLPENQKGYLELGHQFEWAFLLSHAVEKGFPKRYLTTGRRLLDYGMRVAWDREAGGIWSRGGYAGNAVRGPKGWWEQAEFLRAIAHYAARRGRKDLWPAFDQSFAFVKANFIDAEYGGWFRDYDPARPRDERRSSKGSVWMTGYHVCGFYAEALRSMRSAPK